MYHVRESNIFLYTEVCLYSPLSWCIFFFVKSLCNALRQVRPTRSCSMRKKNTKICKKKTAFYRQLEEGGECCLSTLLICFYSPTHSFRRVRNDVHPYNDVFASGPREWIMPMRFTYAKLERQRAYLHILWSFPCVQTIVSLHGAAPQWFATVTKSNHSAL